MGWFVVAGLMRPPALRHAEEVLDSEYVKLARVKGVVGAPRDLGCTR